MAKGKIFISTSSFAEYSDQPLKLLREAGYEYQLNPHGRTMKADEIIKLVSGSIGLVAGTEKLTADVIHQLTGLKVISRCGAGIDNVDQPAMNQKGMILKSTPNAPTLAVAELTVGLILDLMRKISMMDRELRGGQWHKRMGHLLFEKKVGIIGYGRIGKKVAELLKAFGCELAYFDTYHQSDFLNIPRMEMPELLRWADIITVHINSADHLISKNELELLGPKGWLVNTSRGGVVDENALIEYLKDGKIKGAALDVFEQEPYTGPLCQFNNVVLTAHIGSYAQEARIRMEIESVQNLLDVLESKK
ncbi:MAG: phosphoglycerate dehydrogenase [Candidatus Omnitrophica bacterium]|nr:phosphoglycerate dehydrogenase [Candidatus Omnitrophota bacterium]